jgi:hypothetical protein
LFKKYLILLAGLDLFAYRITQFHLLSRLQSWQFRLTTTQLKMKNAAQRLVERH